MIRRLPQSIRWVLVAASSGLVACSMQSDPPRPSGAQVGKTAQAMGNSQEDIDADGDFTNVVVRLDMDMPNGTVGRCTGTLITPQLVLTAQHCILLDALGCATTTIRVQLGHDGAWVDASDRNPSSTVNVYTRRIVQPVCNYTIDTERDIGLLYLERPIPGLPSSRPLTAPIIQPAGYSGTVSGLGMAGWSPGCSDCGPAEGPWSTRRRRYEPNLPLQYHVYDGYGQWEADPDGIDTQGGDSGGPLFVRQPNGLRSVIGVMHGYSFVDTNWADVTGGLGKTWLEEHALDTYMAPLRNERHFPNWYANHGKSSSTMWYGEVDYTGPCDTAKDVDCDHWWDAGPVIHDNCPRIWNPDQTDSNDDGAGDLCQSCAFGKDSDSDGVCDSSDNCVSVPNSTQANCNEAAERANGAAVLGDACDPVPCPMKRVARGITSQAPGGFYDSVAGGLWSGRTLNDKFDYESRLPHVARTFNPSAPVIYTPQPVGVSEINVGARFCQADPSLGPITRAEFCQRPFILNDAEFNHFQAGAEFLDPDHPWLRVALNGGSVGATTWRSFGPGHTQQDTWQFAADNTRWVNAGLIPLPTDTSCATGVVGIFNVGPGTCLDGSMWYHAITGIGNTTPTAGGVTVGIHGPNLANSYTDIAPDPVYTMQVKGHASWKHLFFWEKLFATLPGDHPKARPQPIVVDVTGAHRLFDNGATEKLDESNGLTAVSKAILDSDFQYAPLLEGPGGAPNNIEGLSVESALLASNYTELLCMVVTHERKLMMDGEFASLETAVVGPQSPSPRTGAIAFTSGAMGAVFVIGGQDQVTGQDLKDIYIHLLGNMYWSVLKPTGVTLGKIRAAATTSVDKKLWVIDEVGSNTRLIEINPYTTDAVVLATFGIPAVYTQHTLGVDRDGGLLLVARAPSLGTSKAVRIKRSATAPYLLVGSPLQISGLTQSFPLATADEYTFIVGNSAGTTTGVLHVDDLPPPSDYYLPFLFQ